MNAASVTNGSKRNEGSKQSYLDDVAQQTVGRGIGALDVRPAPRESQLLGLEQEVRVLPTCKRRQNTAMHAQARRYAGAQARAVAATIGEMKKAR